MSKLITTDSLAKLSAGLDARYKSLINDSVSDMVGNSVDAAQATILVEVKKQVDAVKDMLGGKALVYLTQAEYDALSEEEKNDENIVYNITDSESADHEHENLEFLNKITAINITIGKKTQALDFNGNLNFSLEDIGVDNNHKHDEYYTEEEINNVVSNLEALINGKSDTGHNHDDRYYTESEMNTKLADKASKDHSHDEFDTFAIKSEMNSALEGKANKQHEHNEYVTTLKLEEELGSVEESINSVSQSVTTLDTALRGEIGKKADSGHNHNDLYLTKEEVSEDISEAIINQNSELTAEINRVESMLGGKSIVYITQAEYDTLPESEKTNESKTYFITDADDSHNHNDLYYTEDEVNTLLAGKSDTGHNHDDRYYTETEINTKLADKADKTHEHSDLATVDSLNNAVSTINAAIAKKSDNTHNHDGDYYNKTEATTKFSDIEGDITSLGQEITALNTSISSAETRAKSYADQQITALVNSAPEAMNTLGELAQAISDHSTEYEAYVATVATNIATAKAEAIAEAAKKDTALHTTISAEIDADVKVEKERAEAAESVLTTEVNKKLNKSDHGAHLALGTTSSTAFRGDYGNTAYNHSQAAHAPVNAQKNSDITKAEIEAKLTGSITSHNHNGQYYTKTETYTKTEVNGLIEDVNETITTKEATLNAAINGKAPSSHNHTSVNRTMITTPIYNASSGVLVDFNINVKSGAMVILKLYGNSYSANPPIEAIYQFYDYASGDIQQCTGSAISGPSITLKVYKADGKLKAWFQQPNSYCTFKLEVTYGNNNATPNVTLSNAAEPTTNITQTVTITPDRVYSAKYKPSLSDIGAAASSHGTHVTYSTTAPSAAGTASTGSSSSVARADHVHPAQTTISGNAGSATKLATGRAIKLTGMVSGQATFDGTADATITVSAAKVPKSGDWWSGGFATVNSDGVMEVGKYLDFHNTDTGTNDYDVRLQSNTSTPCIITLPTSTGTLALKTDKPETAGVADSTKQSLTVQLNGGTTEGTNKFTFNGSTAKSINITPANIGASATGHNHNDSYYTKSQVDTSIAGITVDSIQAAKKNHTHNQINSRGNVTAETANNRPAVGGLSMSCAYSNGYPTTYGNVMTMKGTGDGQLLIGWSGTSGAHAPAYIRSRRDTTDANWSEWAQIYTTANKPSCNDIGAAPKDNTIATVSVSGGKLTLTKDKRQKCTNMVSGTQINFPTVSNTEFLEVHLYFNAESDMTLALPDNCKWRVDPNLEAGTSYELIATWNTMNWLVNLMVYS